MGKSVGKRRKVVGKVVISTGLIVDFRNPPSFARDFHAVLHEVLHEFSTKMAQKLVMNGLPDFLDLVAEGKIEL